MAKSSFRFLLAGLLIQWARTQVSSGGDTTEESPPNVVIFFADNLGYADVGVFAARTGSTAKSRTPNIDTIARDGMTLTNWNSAAHLCSASRASLLTGKYPARTGTFPGVFKPDAANGLLPSDKEPTTLAAYLSLEEYGSYATSIIGKWHLGHRKEFLPTNHGFDEWLGIPYHMSGGSVDNHTCIYDSNETMWLPLYEDSRIIQQPVRVDELALRYASRARNFIHRNAHAKRPFFLYMPFSHVHQLCAPRDYPEQEVCQWARRDKKESEATFADAVEEMDWIAGRVLSALKENEVDNNTLVIFTSDNGPWVAEQSCSGLKDPFEGRW